MIAFPAAVLCIIFVALAIIHFYWATGGRWGMAAAVPSQGSAPVISPGAAASVTVGLVLLVAAFICLWQGGAFAFGPSWAPRVGVWTVAVIMAARAVGDFKYIGVFKSVRGTVFSRMDTLFYSPLCAAVSALAVWLAVGF